MNLAKELSPRRRGTSRASLHVLLASLLVATTTLAPTALAAPTCLAVTEQPENPLGVYVIQSPLQVWLEGNSEPGLQRQVCERANGALAPTDTFLLDTSAAALLA